MRVRALVCFSVFLATSTIAAVEVRAEEGYQPPVKVKERRVFVGISAGAGYAMVEHPLIKSDGFGSSSLGMHVGYNVSERWAVGLDLSTFEHGMKRTSGTDPFIPVGFLQPQAGCSNCEPPPKGGWISETTAMFGTIGPRAEFAPFGRDGLYLGANTGLGMLIGIDTQFGLGGGARVGYRYRIGQVLGLGVEGGVLAQYFNTGTTVFPFASLVMRPYF
jgi:hypothetical protein